MPRCGLGTRRSRRSLRRPASASSRRLASLLALLAFGLAACSSLAGHYVLVDQRIAHGRYAEADALVARGESVYGCQNAVLYDLDRAMTLHLATPFPPPH